MAAVRRCGDVADLMVGILGCTPSLRTKVRREFPDARVMLIDFCREMFDVTSAVVGDDVKSRERYLAIDWLDMAAHVARETDVLIGDKSLDNVPLDRWADFFRATAGALRPDGMLVLHVGFPDPELAGKPFDMLASPWLRVMTQGSGSLADLAAGLWEDLLCGSARKDTSYLSLEPYRSALARHSGEPSSLGILAARVLADFATKLDAHWTRFDQSDVVSAAAAAGFSFEGEALSGDYAAAQYQPILSFRIALRAAIYEARGSRTRVNEHGG
jgi:hypothetical protein